MFKKTEISWIIIIILIFTFVIAFPSYQNPLILLIPLVIIFTNLITKKLVAPYFNIKITYTIWKFQRFGIYERSYFKKPIPLGLIIPFFITFLSLGMIKPLTFLQFDAENLPKRRALKTRGYYRRTEINDQDLAYTAFWGFFSLLVLAVIGAIIKLPELTSFSIYYGLWNLVPFSNLDGLKLFFGSVLAWVFTVILFIVALLLIIII